MRCEDRINSGRCLQSTNIRSVERDLLSSSICPRRDRPRVSPETLSYSNFHDSNMPGAMTDQTATQFAACRPHALRERHLHFTTYLLIHSPSCADNSRIDELPEGLG